MMKETKQRIANLYASQIPDGYKQTAVGIIPEVWKCKKLKDIAAPVKRKNSKKIERVLTASGQHGLISQDTYFKRSVASEDISEYYHLKKGEFAYNRSSMNGYPYGAIKRLELYDDGALSTLYMCFTLKDNVLPDYYTHLFSSEIVNRELYKIIQVGARAHGLLNVTQDDLYNIHILFPPLPEQEKIAEILTICDKVIELKEKLIEQKTQQKKWLMQNLLTGKKRLGEFEGEWEKKRLGDICKVTTGKLDANAMVENGEYPFFTCAKRSSAIDSYAFDTEAILISGNGANVGYVHYYKGRFNAYQRTYVLDKFKENIFYLKFLLDKDLSVRIEKEKNDGNTPYIVLSTLTQMNILLPPIAEQTAIANVLSNSEKEIELLQKSLVEWKQKKKALMQLLLTGKVRV